MSIPAPRCFRRVEGQRVEIPCPAGVAGAIRAGTLKRRPQQPRQSPRGLGDIIERAVHPIARAIHWPCIDRVTDQLKPQSPCAQARDTLNRALPLPPA